MVLGVRHSPRFHVLRRDPRDVAIPVVQIILGRRPAAAKRTYVLQPLNRPMYRQLWQPFEPARSVFRIPFPAPSSGRFERNFTHPATSLSSFSTSASTALMSASMSSSGLGGW